MLISRPPTQANINTLQVSKLQQRPVAQTAWECSWQEVALQQRLPQSWKVAKVMFFAFFTTATFSQPSLQKKKNAFAYIEKVNDKLATSYTA